MQAKPDVLLNQRMLQQYQGSGAIFEIKRAVNTERVGVNLTPSSKYS